MKMTWISARGFNPTVPTSYGVIGTDIDEMIDNYHRAAKEHKFRFPEVQVFREGALYLFWFPSYGSCALEVE